MCGNALVQKAVSPGRGAKGPQKRGESPHAVVATVATIAPGPAGLALKHHTVTLRNDVRCD